MNGKSRLSTRIFAVVLVTLFGALSWMGHAAQKGGKPPKPGPAANPAIAFSGGGDLWVMNADGSNQAKVYDDPSNRVNRSS